MTGFKQVKLLSIHVLPKFIDETNRKLVTLQNRLLFFYSHVNSVCALTFVTLKPLREVKHSSLSLTISGP